MVLPGSMLFSPFEIGAVTFRNRLWMAPMCQYSALDDGKEIGWPNDWHEIHYSRCARGLGAVIVEATAVNAEGRISPFDLVLDKDEKIPAFAHLAAIIARAGATPGIQIAHAGRKASCAPGGLSLSPADSELGGIGWYPVAPSSLAYTAEHEIPRSLTIEQIEQVSADFLAAGIRAQAAGFKVIQLHAAHGYLLHQFLSPYTNQRGDAYGGSLENRVRLLLRIIGELHSVLTDSVLALRISATDYLGNADAAGRPSCDFTQMKQVCSQAVEAGVQWIDVSSGGLVPDVDIPQTPGYQVPWASQLRAELPVAVGAVGMIRDAKESEAILRSGHADVISVGRPLLQESFDPLLWEKALY